LALSKITSLQRLILNNNCICEITAADATLEATARPFAQLTLLAIAHNQLQAWSSVVSLRNFPLLTEVRVQGSPLFAEMSASVARQLLIASLPSVSTVNGGEVRPRERVEAEKFYIRHSAARVGGVVKLPEEASRDPILAELLARHGLPEGGGGGSGTVATGGGPSSMVEVTLRSMAAASSHKPPVTRRLPASVTVANVKRLCQQVRALRRCSTLSSKKSPRRQRCFHVCAQIGRLATIAKDLSAEASPWPPAPSRPTAPPLPGFGECCTGHAL
jgi:hypothetical protein